MTGPDLLVVGTLAFDDVETPAGRRDRVLGGSATYFGLAASYFTSAGVCGVVGEDFPAAFRQVLTDHDVDLSGVTVEPGGKTFHWSGRYEGAMDQAQTLATDLNVLETFSPALPAPLAAAPYVFLANTHPGIQRAVLDQLTAPRLVVLDTMNLWIDIERDALLAVMKDVDGIVINDQEARDLSGRHNLVAAGHWLLEHGPRHFAVVKKGEHGSFLFSRERLFALPAYPLERIVDPTGAGDSFAGGIMGHLAGRDAAADGVVAARELGEAMLQGTCIASYTCSDFSTDGLAGLLPDQLQARADELRQFIMLP